MTAYCIKLTDEDACTHGGTRWRVGRWNPAGVRSGQGGLCSRGFYHAYDYEDEPVVAHFLNPVGAAFIRPRVWLAEWRGKRLDDRALKFGATEMRVVRELTVPEPTRVQRIAFAILCAERVLELLGVTSPVWSAWAERWLSGEDRSAAATTVAADAADAYATTTAAAYAAYAAAATADADAAAATAAATAAYAAAADTGRVLLSECARWAMVFGATG